tara:strand:- start:198433 stop:198693 length:261 start_codon:yes stop_codon:yes gene_type:complete
MIFFHEPIGTIGRCQAGYHAEHGLENVYENVYVSGKYFRSTDKKKPAPSGRRRRKIEHLHLPYADAHSAAVTIITTNYFLKIILVQ